MWHSDNVFLNDSKERNTSKLSEMTTRNLDQDFSPNSVPNMHFDPGNFLIFKPQFNHVFKQINQNVSCEDSVKVRGFGRERC